MKERKGRRERNQECIAARRKKKFGPTYGPVSRCRYPLTLIECGHEFVPILVDKLLLSELSNCWKWSILLVIGTVPTIKVLETIRVAGASELLDMGSPAGKLQGFSHQSAGNGQGCGS